MAETKMLINYVPGEECRVAIVVDGMLEELQSERTNAVTMVGNIYVGRVMNVEASIQAAFVDFGQGANGFLHVSDLHPQYFPGEDEETTERIGHKTPRRERPPIQACLRRGQEVVVQVLKEGISTKGPTLTSYLSIPGKYLVMLPNMDRVGVSRRVEDEEARREMREILDQLELPEGFGFIARTAGMDRGKMELKRDLAYLQRLWKDIEARMAQGDKPRLLYAESDLLMRALRDTWTSDINEIVIDNEAALHRAARFMKIVAPRCATKLLHYDKTMPMFHAFGIEEQLKRVHAREVPLPSGGSLIVDEAEAMVAIDVNSGKMRDQRDAEATAYKTNCEAVDEICRQLKLRDVGGLIMCDLIDMVSRKNRRDIENRIKDRLKHDRAATKPLPISEFGIVEMTRQRVRGSFRSVHFAKCPQCTGRGVLRRPESVATDAIRELGVVLDYEKVAKVEMVVSPRVAGELLSSKRQALWRIERSFNKRVDVRVSEDIPVDQFRLYAYDEAGADIEIEALPAPRPPKKLTEWKIGGEKDADWTLDSAVEAPEVPEPEHESALSPVEEAALAAAEVAEDDMDMNGAPGIGAPAGADTGEGGRRRRRRRRRRGGRGRGEDDGAPLDGAPLAEARTPAPESNGGGFNGSDEAGGDGTGRRRRRRRRGGRGRGGAGGEAPIGDMPMSAPTDGPAPGDSWDVEPSSVQPARQHDEMAPASTEDRSSSWDVEPGEVPEGSAPRGADAEDGEGGGRRRRRRRRGRGGRDRADGAPSERGEAGPAESPPAEERPREGSGDGQRGGGRRRGRGGAGGGSGGSSGGGGDRGQRNNYAPRPAVPQPSAPVVVPGLPVPAVKPARSLYGTRRKLPGGAAGPARGREE